MAAKPDGEPVPTFFGAGDGKLADVMGPAPMKPLLGPDATDDEKLSEAQLLMLYKLAGLSQ